jgi:hypothetical protein
LAADKDIIIAAEDLTKAYKMYPTSVSRFRELVSPTRRKFHTEVALQPVEHSVL